MASDVQSDSKRQPIETLQVGNIKVWFWENHTQDRSRTFVNLTFTRERDGGHFTSFGKRDLSSLARAVKLAESCFDEYAERAANHDQTEDERGDKTPF